MLPTKSRKCNKCKSNAKYWDGEKWWCKMSYEGYQGTCTAKKGGK